MRNRKNNKSKNKMSLSAKAHRVKRVKEIGGVKLKLDFVSSAVLNDKNENKRIDFILDIVKDGTILITDGVMTPDEELNLIRETMRKVDDGFPGIEVASLRREAEGYQKIFEQLSEQRHKLESIVSKIRGSTPPKLDLKYGMTLIGPSKLIKEIKKNPDSFSVFAGA